MSRSLDELVVLEQAAAAQSLGFATSPAAWWEVVAGAQAGLADAHVALRTLGRSAYSSSRLSVAARMLDAASRPNSDIPEDERRRLALVALQAFAMDGNTPSAMAILARFPDLTSVGSPNELVSVATALPSQLGAVLGAVASERHLTYLEILNHYLESGDESTRGALQEYLVSFILDDSSSLESVLLGGAINTLQALDRFAVSTILRPKIGPFLTTYVDRVVAEGIRTLLPPQVDAIESAGLLGRANAVVVMPTSTGKTLLAELALIGGLEHGPGLVCYVAPYIALGRQVAQTLRRRIRGQARVHPMIGGYRLPRPLDPINEREIAVCTPERFDALLRLSPEIYDHLRAVVIDEAHLVANGDRGARLEGIVARLRTKQDAGWGGRIVLLSAVVPNPEDLAAWLGPTATVAASTWRPSVRRTVLWRSDGRLSLLVGDDRLRRTEQTASTVLGTQPLPWPQTNFYATSNVGQQLAQLPRAYENVAYLARFLLERREGSVLVVCGSRKATRALARFISDNLPSIEPTPPTVGRLMARIQKRYPYLGGLQTGLESGVAYHNAALPGDLRELIEDAVRQGQLAAVVATTTLAEGVDLPFRFTVLADWLVPSDKGQRPMDPLLFKNIAGRSGRAGWHTEGVTVVYDNLVGDPALVAPQTRGNLQQQVFASDTTPGLRSTFSRGSDGYEKDRGAPIVSSNFLAAIPENPAEEHLDQVLFEHSLAARHTDGEPLLRLLASARDEVLIPEEHGAFATASSPLTLTPLGHAANITGLSPAGCRAVLRAIETTDPARLGFNEIAAVFLRALIDIPEQDNGKLRQRLRGSNNRYPVEDSDLETLLSDWLDGVDESQLFRGLGFVRRSSRRPSVHQWLSGEADSPTWPDVFDQFIDFRSVTISGFLPWVLRAAAALEAFVVSDLSYDWELLADLVESGTNNRWAATAAREAAPGPRWVLNAVGAELESVGSDVDDPLSLRLCNTSPLLVSDAFDRVAATLSNDDRADLDALRVWLFERAIEARADGDA